uniref:Tetratricopeptide repeat domain 4 n=1 Tax=Poecilia formosa TaxID=48698 RepID=A0A096LZI5_POEFO
MASTDVQDDSDDGMDAFMDKFKSQRYKNAFTDNNWEEEFNKIPMFMKTAPEEIDHKKYPELACLQSIIHDEDRSPEEQAKSLKDEGNAFFKEKNYKYAVVAYTAALNKKCEDQELNAVLLTNRAASHFHLGKKRYILSDTQLLGLMHNGVLSLLLLLNHLKLEKFCSLINQCSESQRVFCLRPSVLSAKRNNRRRAAERDARKAKAKEKKLHGEKEALLGAIKLYFEDEEKETLYQVDPEMSLLKTLQHKRFFVKAGTPSFMVLVKDSPFCKQFLSEKKIHGL